MISESRLAANRANAQRSTGPRTEQGKLTSRRNSFKHGLTGNGDVLSDDLAKAVAAKEKQFVDCARPANEMEHAFVHRMALAAVRMDQAEQTEAARRNARRGRVAKRFERSLIESTTLGARLLVENPAEGLSELEATSVGCTWVIRQWKALEQKISSGKCWSSQDLTQAFALLGLRADEPHADCKSALSLRMIYLVFQPHIDFDEADRLLVIDTSQYAPRARVAAYAEILPSPDEALGMLRTYFDGEVARWEQLRDKVRVEVEEPELKDRLQRVGVDSSPEGMRLSRYDTTNELAFHRNWNAFHRLRKTGAETMGLSADEPAPAPAQNEPNPMAVDIAALESYVLSRDGAGTSQDVDSEAGSAPQAVAEAVETPFEGPEVPLKKASAVALSA